MAQLNITLNQDEILQLLLEDRGDAFKSILQASLNKILQAESSEQLKAAELMAKYHGLFTPKEETAIRPEVIAEIEAAVREIAQRQEEKADAAKSGDRAADDAAGEGGPLERA